MIVEQDGVDCIVTVTGVTRRVKNAKAFKLANTMLNKEGEKYTEEEMNSFGLFLRRKRDEKMF